MRGAALLVAAALLLAGCSGGGPEPSTPSGPTGTGPQPQAVEVDADSPFGAISGFVVDDAIQLLAGVQVALLGTTRNVTSPDGYFSFTDLEPGAYNVNATFAGHASATTTVDVVAGKVTDARLQLQRIPGLQPYSYTLEHSGFVVASGAAAGVIVDAAVQGMTGQNPFCERCIFTVEREGQDVRTLVVDMVWDNTLGPVTGEDLFLTIIPEHFSVDKPGWGASVTSPYTVHIAEDDPAFLDGHNSTFWRFQVGGSLTQPTYNQQYELFVTVFVNAPAPTGWSVSNRTA